MFLPKNRLPLKEHVKEIRTWLSVIKASKEQTYTMCTPQFTSK